MFVITSRYRIRHTDVVGREFATEGEAMRFLCSDGWRKCDDSREWCKEGPTRLVGCIAVGCMQYVSIEKRQEKSP